MLVFFPSLYSYCMCHRQAHLIYLNYVITFQDGNIFPASKVVEVAGRGGSCI